MKKIFSETTETAVKEFLENLGQGTVMESNKAINSLFGAGEFATRILRNGEGLDKAIENTFKKDGAYNVGKIAGSYIGASAAYRVASGGGIHRDKNGNPNIIGVPFV